MKIQIIFILFLSMVFFTNCKKELSIPGSNPGSKTMDKLATAENFDWKMSRELTFLVTGKSNTIVKITSVDGNSLYHKCVIPTGKIETIINLSLPSVINEVVINNQKITLSQNILQVSLSLKDILSSSNKGLDLDGTGRADMGDHSEFNPGTGDFTCEAWVKTSDASSDTWYRRIFGKGFGYSTYIFNDGTVQVYYNSHASGSSTTAINDGNWHHVAVTRQSDHVKLYIDGALEFDDNDVAYMANLSSSEPFTVGVLKNGGNTQGHWHGQIDEVRNWDYCRSAGEIMSDHDKKINNLHPQYSHLTGSWDCDETLPVPGSVKDRTSHGHDGTLEGGCNVVPIPMPQLDSDGDGVPDISDDYPNDPLRAFNNYFPVLSDGTLVFEDLWPAKGDYDFNDLVLGYRFLTVTNYLNEVVEINATFTVRANGAQLRNGFGFQLPGMNPAALAHINATGYNLSGGVVTLNGSNHLEAGQSLPTCIVFDDTWSLMKGFANTPLGSPFVTPVPIEYTISVTGGGPFTAADFLVSSWNPFLIINQTRGQELHLLNDPPTSLVNTSYFGMYDDASNLLLSKYYRTAMNVPWALDFPVAFDYPGEKIPINQAYTKFIEWAESGGVLFTDWYTNPAYRDNSKIYSHQ